MSAAAICATACQLPQALEAWSIKVLGRLHGWRHRALRQARSSWPENGCRPRQSVQLRVRDWGSSLGLYIRKSIKAGPFRFNLSKSGIGVSAGVPGFRIGNAPESSVTSTPYLVILPALRHSPKRSKLPIHQPFRSIAGCGTSTADGLPGVGGLKPAAIVGQAYLPTLQARADEQPSVVGNCVWDG